MILVGIGMVALAHYKIRRICERYPIEMQIKCDICVRHGGPWPQKTNAPAKP
jgi:hypothetical protein